MANEGDVWADASSANGAGSGAVSGPPGATSGAQPNVDAILTNVASLSVDAERKSTITQRKPVAKKTGVSYLLPKLPSYTKHAHPTITVKPQCLSLFLYDEAWENDRIPNPHFGAI